MYRRMFCAYVLYFSFYLFIFLFSFFLFFLVNCSFMNSQLCGVFTQIIIALNLSMYQRYENQMIRSGKVITIKCMESSFQVAATAVANTGVVAAASADCFFVHKVFPVLLSASLHGLLFGISMRQRNEFSSLNFNLFAETSFSNLKHTKHS